MSIIETNREAAIVDDQDGDLAHFHWYINVSGSNKYAMSHGVKRDNGRPSYLHRIIARRIDPGHDGVIVFRDGNTLNCQRANLIICTHADSVRMQGVTKRNTTGYKGVSAIGKGRFRSYICFNGHRIHLGIFDSAEDAADEYDWAARLYFGEFAHTNHPKDQ